MSNEQLDPLDQKKGQIQTFFKNPLRMKSLESALPSVGVTNDRIVRALFTAISQNPKLAECTPESLFTSLIQSATLGLVPNTPLGHSYLIPYKNKNKGVIECQFQVGYKGFLVLGRRSGEITSWNARVVYLGDFFNYEYGTADFIKHKPMGDMLVITHVYSVVHYKDGGVDFEVMTKKQIDSARARSKSPNHGPWVTDYEPMSMKAVMKRLANRIPMATDDLAKAIALDGKNEVGDTNLSGLIDLEPEQLPEPKKTGLEVMAEAKQEDDQPEDTESKPSTTINNTTETAQLDLKQQEINKIPDGVRFEVMKKLSLSSKKVEELTDKECDRIAVAASDF